MVIEIDWVAFFTVIALGIALTAFFTYAMESIWRPGPRPGDEGAHSSASDEVETPREAERGKVPALSGR